MAIALFKDLCVDANDPVQLGRFWAAALDRTWEAKEDGGGFLTGPTPQHRIWVNEVPEPKTGKNRIHWDVSVADLAP
jgi:Glyoxalase-like domain